MTFQASKAKRRPKRRPLLAPAYWGTIAEAAAALTAATLVTRFLPFKRYIGFGVRPVASSREDSPQDVVRIVNALGDRLPFRAVCLQRGLALQWMLRRRGIDAALHYGIRLTGAGEQIAAHVWVSADDNVLLGAPQHEQYAEVARYPAPSAA
nr:lasso peptide biosynthesis B2 protein [uncultured Sphingomonas sp.]